MALNFCGTLDLINTSGDIKEINRRAFPSKLLTYGVFNNIKCSVFNSAY